MTIAALIVALFGFVSLASAMPVVASPAPMGFPGSGDTIRIDDNGDFTNAIIQYGWNGTGTSGDPIVLDGTLGDPQIDMAGAPVGIYIANITTYYFKIVNWTINNTANAGIGIQIENIATAFEVHDVEINNTYDGIKINDTASPEIYNNTIYNTTRGIRIENTTAPMVRDNVIFDEVAVFPVIHYGVFLYYCTNGFVNDNTMYEINEGVELEYCNNIRISGNTVTDCVIAFYLDQASIRTFIDNNTVTNMQEWGVTLNYGADNTTVVDNDFTNCDWAGVDVAMSDDVRIKDNTFTDCTHGVYTRWDGVLTNRRITVLHNVFTGGTYGVSLNVTLVASVSYNSFLGCSEYGVFLNDTTSGISVHHNVFKGCNSGGVQGYDTNTGVNDWNDASGFGNYWDDHRARDLHDTGIVPTPYTLDGAGEQDLYPLNYTIGPAYNLDAVAGVSSVYLTWSASNYSAGAYLAGPESVYKLSRSGGAPIVIPNRTPGNENWNDATVVPGTTYTYQVIANNTYGDAVARSIVVSVPSVNTPMVNITSPANNSVFTVNSVTVNWEGWGNGSAITKYEIRMDSDPIIDKGLAITHTFNGVADGMHNITVIITNAIPNTGFDLVTVTVDTTAPTLTITSPAEGFRSNKTLINVAWTGSDDTTGIKNYSMRVDSGAWKNENLVLADTVVLQNGTHLIEVRAIDNAGNVRIRSVNLSVDMNAPTVTFIDPTDESFTNRVNFTALWNVSDASGVLYSWVRLANTTGAFGPWVNMTGVNATWMTNLTDGKADLIDGTWALEIAAVDILGNNGSSICNFTVDTVKPTVSITSPADGSYDNTGNVTVSWIASDGNMDYVAVMLDGGGWMSVGTNTSHWFANLSDGSRTVHVRAFDKAGNFDTAVVHFIVDTVAPVISDMAPGNGSYLMSAVNLFAWNVTDATSGVNRTMVSVDSDTPVDIMYLKNYTTASMLDGWHWFNVTVFDNATNSASASVMFFVDTHGPVLVISQPSEGAMLDNATVHFEWVGSDPEPQSGIAYYEYNLDAAGWINMGMFTYADLLLTEGNHTFQLRAFDVAGNPSNVPSVSLMVDLTAPSLSIVSPAEGALIGSANVTVVWNGSDAMSGIQGYKVSVDNSTWVSAGLATNYEFVLSDGPHSVLVNATDNAGNYVVRQVNFTIDVTTPFVEILGPAHGTILGVNWTVVSWNATDNTTGLALVQLWIDSGARMNVTAPGDYNFTGLAEGDHTIYVEAWDQVGHSQQKSVTILVDLSAPTISITAPTAGQFLNSATVNAQFSAIDTLSGVNVTKVRIDSGDWVVVTGNSYAFTGVAAGQHTIYVFSQDNMGNNDTKSVQFTVDLTAPTIVSHVPLTGANGVLRASTITVVFSEEMLSATVTLSPSVAAGTPTWNTEKTQLTYAPGASMAYATLYTVTVTGTDRAGNALTGTTSWTFTTIAHVTGIVKDPKGNPIANATVNMTTSAGYWNEVKTGPDGSFAIDVPTGNYNLTISASGMKELKQEVPVSAGSTNVLGDLGMTAVDDWTWLIIVLAVVVVAAIAVWYLFLRKKPAAPAAKPKVAEKPKAEEKPKDKK